MVPYKLSYHYHIIIIIRHIIIIIIIIIIILSVYDGRLKQLDSFTYLGSRVTSNADYVSNVKYRLAMGMAVMIRLTRLWKNS